MPRADIKVMASGLLALAGVAGRSVVEDILVSAATAAQSAALEEWGTGSNVQAADPLPLRFTQAGFVKLGLSKRSKYYMQRVIRSWGQYRPYTSPKGRLDYERLTVAILQQRGDVGGAIGALAAMDELLRQGRRPAGELRQSVLTGQGVQVKTAGRKRVNSRLIVRQARKLNRIQGGAGARYRAEFIGWDRAQGKRGARWIEKRRAELYWLLIGDALDRLMPAELARGS